MALSRHPFEFKARWRDVLRDTLSDSDMTILDERDRDLEDYLSTVGGGGTMMASSLSRSTTQTTVASTVPINFNTTDYLNGCTATTYSGAGCLQIDVPGVWHCTTVPYAWMNSVSGYGYVYLSQRNSGGTVIREIHEFLLNGGPYADQAFPNLACDFNCSAGDLITVDIRGQGSSSGYSGGVSGGVALLQAHLVG